MADDKKEVWPWCPRHGFAPNKDGVCLCCDTKGEAC